MLLKDKVVIISGIGPGLGQELAYGASENGAKCVLAARTQEKLDQVKEEGSIAHLSKYFQEALLCLQKPSSERDNKDLKVLADLTSNVPAFKKLSKDKRHVLFVLPTCLFKVLCF